jgi:endoglucanase
MASMFRKACFAVGFGIAVGIVGCDRGDDAALDPVTAPHTSPTQLDVLTLPAPVPSFRRGMNLGNRLDAPEEGAWGPVLSESDFPRIAARGFDHVRLPVRFSAHAAKAPPYAIDSDFIARVDWAVEQALQAGLSIVIDLHHYEELFADPAAEGRRFVGLWEELSEHYAGFPDAVAFELVNEPQAQLDAERWNGLFPMALARVRQLHPTRRVIIDGPDLGYAPSLPDLVMPVDDPNLLVAVHIYTPTLFTFQGSSTDGPSYATTGIVFPGPPLLPLEPAPEASGESWVTDWIDAYNTLPAAENPSGPSVIDELFDAVDTFVVGTRLPIYLGEWGVGDGADLDSRVHYLHEVRAEAEARGIGWAIWENGNAYELLDPATGVWQEELVDALLSEPTE